MPQTNRALVIVFAGLAVAQTAMPIVAQKLTDVIIYPYTLYGAVAACAATGVGVAIFQTMHRRFGKRALMAFYIGLVLLIAFDIWIKRAIDASC